MTVIRLYSSIRSFITVLDNIKEFSWVVPRLNIGTKTILAQHFSTNKWSMKDIQKGSFKISENKDGTIVKKKMFTTPKILLIDLKNSKTSMYLEQAQKLAKHDGVELVQVDADSIKPVYRLVKTSKMEDLPSKNKSEKFKKFFIKSELFDHDLNTKINQIIKVLDKGCLVYVEIVNKQNNPTKLDNIIDKLKKEIGTKHEFGQQISRKTSIMLKILPSTEEKENKEGKTS